MPATRPGAVFVLMLMNDAVWQVLQSTPGLMGFAGSVDRPTAYLRSSGPLHRYPQDLGSPWKAGEKVRITDGPFIDFHATVIEVKIEHHKVLVMVDVFGRATPVELNFD